MNWRADLYKNGKTSHKRAIDDAAKQQRDKLKFIEQDRKPGELCKHGHVNCSDCDQF